MNDLNLLAKACESHTNQYNSDNETTQVLQTPKYCLRKRSRGREEKMPEQWKKYMKEKINRRQPQSCQRSHLQTKVNLCNAFENVKYSHDLDSKKPFNSSFASNQLTFGSENITPSRKLFLLVEQKDWKQAIMRSRSHPQDARWTDSSWWTVLHRAVCDQAPFEVIWSIWYAFPGALFSQSYNNKTPLHCVFRFGCSSAVLKFLLERCCLPDSLDELINLPKDLLKNGVLPFIGEKNVLRIQDMHGWTVLHWMIFCQAPAKQVSMVVNEYPDALLIVNVDLKTPLHLACCHKDSIDTVQVLLDACPDALRIIDKDGRTPYQIARVKRHFNIAEFIRCYQWLI